MSATDETRTGRLFVVATPIGNLEDISLRALRVLREADRVLAEDTRHTRGLLSHYDIRAELASLHAHTPPERVHALADELAQGARFALVTDAGTPVVSDPGRELVAAAIARGVDVEAVPGASAVLSALCVSGVSSDTFRFVGFLPRSGRRRREALNAIAHDGATTVLFEAPNRLAATLAELSALCSAERRAAVCRELTKLHEEVQRGTLSELTRHFAEGARGEITLVVEGLRREESADALPAELDEAPDVDALLDARLKANVPAKEVARELASLIDIDRREAYRRVVDHRLRRSSQES